MFILKSDDQLAQSNGKKCGGNLFLFRKLVYRLPALGWLIRFEQFKLPARKWRWLNASK